MENSRELISKIYSDMCNNINNGTLESKIKYFESEITEYEQFITFYQNNNDSQSQIIENQNEIIENQNEIIACQNKISELRDIINLLHKGNNIELTLTIDSIETNIDNFMPK